MGLSKNLWRLFVAGLLASSCVVYGETCPGYMDGQKQVFFGDLHVHSGYSLDAWGYGTASTPAQAYEFARGATMELADGSTARLSRPLDFMAVTDHAEWFNLMYICTDPERSSHAYCDILTEKNTPELGGEVFQNYVLPTITKAQPSPTPLCLEQPEACSVAHLAQWQRMQDQANAANDPCQFTSFVAFEWSATPDFSHNHRNVIFADENVTADAIDYMRFPTPAKLWRELDQQCRKEDGCDVIAIPHNTNMGDGKSFDIETESNEELSLRARFERLVEIHQEKGNSECLPAFGQSDEDCSFERYLTKNSRPATPASYNQAEWEQMRNGYVRRLLLRGLYGYEQSAERQLNPLQLGIIGSTDNHTGTGGFVEEGAWPGGAFGLGGFDRAMSRIDWNPGGLVAVWAEQNTRADIFNALKRREVFATSGPRLRVRINASEQEVSCESDKNQIGVPMGGVIKNATSAYFRIQAQADQLPITAVELVKGQLRKGELHEQVVLVWDNKQGAQDVCAVWRDPEFNADTPAFWYARVLEAPSPRWSAFHCQREARCDEYPRAHQWIRERAWTSPVWFLPEYSAN